MKKWFFCILAFVTAAATSVCSADDWQMWNKYNIGVPVIKDKLFIKGTFETRFRDDLDEFFRYHFYIGPDYKLYKWLTLGLRYGNIQSGDPGDFHTEHRLMQYVTPKFKLADLGVQKYYLGPLTLNLENRLDWRIRHDKEYVYTWRYRIYPKFSYPVYKTEKLTISPYVGNAFYFDFTDGIAYNQNRIYAGLSFKMLQHIGMGFYYMRLASRSGSGGPWTGAHVIGTQLGYDF
jgi:hypothetical protein